MIRSLNGVEDLSDFRSVGPEMAEKQANKDNSMLEPWSKTKFLRMLVSRS